MVSNQATVHLFSFVLRLCGFMAERRQPVLGFFFFFRTFSYIITLIMFSVSFFVILSCTQVDERALRDIMEMGFNREAARQALMDNNNNLEAALNSLLTGSSGCRPGPVAAESHKPQPRGLYAHIHSHTHMHDVGLKLKPPSSQA